MSQSDRSTPVVRRRVSTQLAATGLAIQIGCVTLSIIGAALVAGLWIDNLLGARPLVTLVLMFSSMPVTLYVVYRLALAAARRMQAAPGNQSDPSEERELDR